MFPPLPTPIVRITHIDNIPILLRRQGLHSPSRVPEDGLFYKPIHDIEVQSKRSTKILPCGPKGTLVDYVPFYFGYLSPMLLRLHTNKVSGYTEGQRNIAYLVATVQQIKVQGLGYVFSDGQGLKHYTKWYDDVRHLDKISWPIVYGKQWADQDDDNDRMRKKQAEFLVHEFLPWELIEQIVVIDQERKEKVCRFFLDFSKELHRPVSINRFWYY